MLVDASSLTKSIIDKGLSKVDKINKLSDTVIDKGSETVENTSDSYLRAASFSESKLPKRIYFLFITM